MVQSFFLRRELNREEGEDEEPNVKERGSEERDVNDCRLPWKKGSIRFDMEDETRVKEEMSPKSNFCKTEVATAEGALKVKLMNKKHREGIRIERKVKLTVKGKAIKDSFVLPEISKSSFNIQTSNCACLYIRVDSLISFVQERILF